MKKRFFVGLVSGCLVSGFLCVLYYNTLPEKSSSSLVHNGPFPRQSESDGSGGQPRAEPVPIDSTAVEQTSNDIPAPSHDSESVTANLNPTNSHFSSVLLQNIPQPPDDLDKVAAHSWVVIRDAMASLVRLGNSGTLPKGRVFWSLVHLNWHSLPEGDDTAIGEGYARFLSLLVGEELVPEDPGALARLLKHYSLVAQDEEREVFRAHGMDASRKGDYEVSSVRSAKREVFEVFAIFYDELEPELLECFEEGTRESLRRALASFYEESPER